MKRTKKFYPKKLDNLISKASPIQKLFAIGALVFGILGLAFTAHLTISTQVSEEAYNQNIIDTITFPTIDLHYGKVTNISYKPSGSDIELYIALNSKESKNAYNSTLKFAKKNDLSVHVIHLGQNPEWEESSRTFYTLMTINPDINLEPFFNFFITHKKTSNLKNEITPLLVEQKINTSTFSRLYDSIEIVKTVNDDIKFSNDAKIEFVPSVILHGKFYIYFGSFDSYLDSYRLFDALKSYIKQEDDTKNTKNTPDTTKNN